MTDLFDLREARIRNGDDPGDPLRTLYVEDGYGNEVLVKCLTRKECIRTGFYFIWRGLFPKSPRR